jgi:hypothetical protein
MEPQLAVLQMSQQESSFNRVDDKDAVTAAAAAATTVDVSDGLPPCFKERRTEMQS